MQDVADVYGTALTNVHEEWLAMGNAVPAIREFPDGAKEELRQVLYGSNSPFALTPREALDAYLLDAADNQKVAQEYLSFDAWLMGTGKAADRAHVLFDSSRIHEPHVFVRGNPERTGRAVRRAAPQLLGTSLAAPFRFGSGRLELASVIAHPKNPLTARVIVNRVWKHHFGAALVPTTSNFGLRATPPSHPELLDYLARRFIDEGWSLKRLHRQILTSSTWQQASVDRPNAAMLDPENRLLWRAFRRRVDFETLRDALLFVSGRLNLQIGGPPLALTASDNFRRTIYGRIDRSALPSVLQLFDFPSPDTHAPNRSDTTAPQQALYLMNSPFVQQQALALAERASQAAAASAQSPAAELYRLALGRDAASDELKRATAYLHSGAQLSELAQALIVSNEFQFVD